MRCAAATPPHDRRLFSDVSRLIYSIITEFYAEAAARPLLTALIVAHLRYFAQQNTLRTPHIRHYQTFGDLLRAGRPQDPHFHAIVLEGGFDNEGTVFYVGFSGLQSMVEIFQHRVIELLVDRGLLNEDFARNLLSWKRSGFSIDYVCILRHLLKIGISPPGFDPDRLI